MRPEGRIVEAGSFLVKNAGPMANLLVAGGPTKVECGLSLISPSPEDFLM
jgi:hypothetical protein